MWASVQRAASGDFVVSARGGERANAVAVLEEAEVMAREVHVEGDFECLEAARSHLA